MLRSILWKEWREQRWKVAFGTVMLSAFTVSFAVARMWIVSEALFPVGIVGGLFMALYSAMGVFAPERSNRTLPFLVAQPGAPWQVFAGKWFVGWLNVAIPILASGVCLAVCSVSISGRTLADASTLALWGTLACLALGTMIYTWICCLTMRCRSEAPVGLAGLLIFVGLLVHMWLGCLAMNDAVRRADLRAFPWAATPNPLMWLIFLAWRAVGAGGFLAIQVLVFAALIAYGFRCWRRSL